MIEWQDDAIVLAARPHGEGSAVVQLLTRDRGRHAGLVRGGLSSRQRGVYQTGNEVRATWKARLAEHLGAYTCELTAARAAAFLDQPERLTALSAAAAVTEEVLAEREPHPACFDALRSLIDALDGEHWGEVYVQWELLLLRELGFGLDLTRCAAGGENDHLAYVSPKSGRAVSLSGGAPYKERLLSLPAFLVGRSEGGAAEVAQGLKLTGYFFERHLFHPRDRALPAARQRLAESFAKAANTTRKAS